MISVLQYHRELDRAVRKGFDATDEGIQAHREYILMRLNRRREREFQKRRKLEQAEAIRQRDERMSGGMSTQTATEAMLAANQALMAMRQMAQAQQQSYGSSCMPNQYPMQYWDNHPDNATRYGMSRKEIEQAALQIAEARNRR